MATPYFTPPKNEIAAPLRDWDRLKASGNLTYREFISLVTELWHERVPDVPLFPIQGKRFAQYPCIVYGIEVKTTMKDEVKKRHREYVTNPHTGQLYKITGQRFKLLVSFAVITENEPELAEEIMEAFEDFMDETTAVYKKLGLSEIRYGRRLPDSTENRESEDITRRSVVFEVYIERVRQVPVDQLNEILVTARTALDMSRNMFHGEAGDSFITVEAHVIPESGEVLVDYDPNPDVFLPLGLHAGRKYVVAAVDGNKLYLETTTGTPILLGSSGAGRLSLWLGKVKVDIQDEFATPHS